jgi:pimeloyl-ACP methyl ester carboxylesterase
VDAAGETGGRALYPDMTTTTLPAITHRYLTANGVRLHVVQAGTSGPPVLLLHGYPQHWQTWRHVITQLAEDHRRPTTQSRDDQRRLLARLLLLV